MPAHLSPDLRDFDRTQVLETFADRVYGRPAPGSEVDLGWRVLDDQTRPDGTVRRQLALSLIPQHDLADGARWVLTLLVDLPADRTVPAPVLMGLNFQGNHASRLDPGVFSLSGPARDRDAAAQLWGEQLHTEGLMENRPDPCPRGDEQRRWPTELATARGYGVITCCYLQIGPDSDQIHSTGLPRLFEDADLATRPADRWGSIGVWAWVLSRIQDALAAQMVPEIDPAKVVILGHSRLGKAALWAGAQDQRFAAVISNDSGALGAALSRPVGETPGMLADIRPQWFARAFAEWAHDERPLIDQPALLACIAPRPLYVASASLDAHADPEGEFASWQQASAAWPGGIEATAGEFPQPGECRHPVSVPLGYHLREGEHDTLAFDWNGWLDFADRWVR